MCSLFSVCDHLYCVIIINRYVSSGFKLPPGLMLLYFFALFCKPLELVNYRLICSWWFDRWCQDSGLVHHLSSKISSCFVPVNDALVAFYLYYILER